MARLKMPRPMWHFLLVLRVVQFIHLMVLVAFIHLVTVVIDTAGAWYFCWASIAVIAFTSLFLVFSLFFNCLYGDIRLVFMYTRYSRSALLAVVPVSLELLFCGAFTTMAVTSNQSFVFADTTPSYDACVSALHHRIYVSVVEGDSVYDFDLCEYRQGILILASIVAGTFGIAATLRLVFRLEPKEPTTQAE
ncbi:hypothetical protein F4819DRAFT_465900 [Hypoxylon fuscum]|nr:hypothetical protein F4819DRAFT_465900 [Hypoxylon fuscum]